MSRNVRSPGFSRLLATDDQNENCLGTRRLLSCEIAPSYTRSLTVMEIIYLVGILVVWFALQKWILPRLGIRT